MTDDKFRQQLLDVLVPVDKPLAYRNISLWLPISDYASLKALSLELNKPLSDLARSLLLVALEASELLSSQDD